MAEQIAASYDDYAALERFAEGLDVVTYEFENVPVDAARFLSERVPVFPPPTGPVSFPGPPHRKDLLRRPGHTDASFR